MHMFYDKAHVKTRISMGVSSLKYYLNIRLNFIDESSKIQETRSQGYVKCHA